MNLAINLLSDQCVEDKHPFACRTMSESERVELCEYRIKEE